MADVARHAEVSIATVSRALRDLPGVSDETRQRIQEVAEELSYVVSPEASRLSRREKGRIAVVVRKLDDWFYASMLAAIEATVRNADFDVLVYQVDGETQRRRFFQHLPARRKVDAVVLIALPLLAEEEERLDLLGVQVIVAGGRLRDYPHVQVDDHEIAVRAVTHLLDLGHRRIAMIRTLDTEGSGWSSDVRRTRGYVDALERRGLGVRDDYVVSEPYSMGAGVRGVSTLLGLDDPPTAVFCYSDEIALSALSALLARGVAVPDQISLIGVDGHPLAALFGLDTVVQSIGEQGRIAGEMALSLVRGEQLARPAVTVASELVLRGSSGPPTS